MSNHKNKSTSRWFHVDAQLFDLSCLLERAEVVGNLGLESFDSLPEHDREVLLVDLLFRIREARAAVSACAEVNRPTPINPATH
ncbi:hypothetical protein [Marinobacterium lacunae]|uniref:hypothetical protein n=1 Tax=Marinobacterium lacunae TaxID=1232683 RepID=UPI0005601364|nr:hypothetical protein [Marinobacterium lacunae]